MPVEQVRRNREPTITNRRTNALKHQHTHPGAQSHPSVLKDSFGSTKSGHVNGVNAIGLRQSFASPSNQPMSTSMSSKMANMTGSKGSASQSLNLGGACSVIPLPKQHSCCFHFIFVFLFSPRFSINFLSNTPPSSLGISSIKSDVFDINLCIFISHLFLNLKCAGESYSAQSTSVQCLKPRPPTTCNLDYISPKSVLLQPKLMNSYLDGKQKLL